MARLTEVDEQGNWCLKGLSWEAIHTGKKVTQDIWEKLYGALCKLKDYEEEEHEKEIEDITDDDGMLNVIAWKEHSEPYQPRICTDKECPYNKGTDCPAAAGCGGYEPKQTNADRIRAMSNEELGEILLCPYDTAGKSINIMPCVKDGVMKNVSIEECRKCMLDWLQSEAEEERRETVE